MKKVLCFGELLLRLSPQLNGDWIKYNSMPVYIGGAELNVATALANWGLEAAYCTALPDNYLSQEIVSYIEHKKVDTTSIIFSGNRVGTYYLPQGADLKNAGVIYDRAHSSFADINPGQIDWDEVLQDVKWFHFSAISPALNENIAIVCKQALQHAVQRGIYVSVDLNYRAKLWQYGKQPSEVMPDLVQYCDLIMGNIWAAEKMLGIPLNENILDNKEGQLQQAEQTSKEILRQYHKCKQVANTFRFDVRERLLYFATLYMHNHFYVSQQHDVTDIVDKAGSGDCFMAGLIYGNTQKTTSQEIIDFAAAAAVNKLFIKGDATTASVEEIKKGYMNYA